MDTNIMEIDMCIDDMKIDMLALEYNVFINNFEKYDPILTESVGESIKNAFKKFIEIIKTLIKKIKETFKKIKMVIIDKIKNFINKYKYKSFKKEYNNGKMDKVEFALYLYGNKYKNDQELHKHIKELFKDKTFHDYKHINQIYDKFYKNANEIINQTKEICQVLDDNNNLSYDDYSKLLDQEYNIEEFKTFIKGLEYNYHKDPAIDLKTLKMIDDSNENILKQVSKIKDMEQQITNPLFILEDKLHKILVTLEKQSPNEYTNNTIKDYRRIMNQTHKNISAIWNIIGVTIQTSKDIIYDNVNYSITCQRAYDEIIKYDEEHN